MSSLPVVKSLDVPFDEWEVLSIVFGMAFGALLAGVGRDVVVRVEAAVGCQARANLDVTA